MAYESINVRMTRTGKSITWGFSLRQNGPAITVAYVEKDSMAEKSGIEVGDTLEQIFGSKPGNLTEVQNRIQNSNELSMTLKRFVRNPPALPWTLEDSGNQVIVNRFDNNGRLTNTYDKNTAGYQNSFHTTQSYGPPASQEVYKTTNYKRTETHETGPAPINYDPLPFSNTVSSESHSNWDHEEGNIKKHFETNRTYTRTESTNVVPVNGGGFQGSISNFSSGAPFGNFGNSGQFNNNFSSNFGSSGAPFTNQNTFNSNFRQNTYSGGSGAPFSESTKHVTYSNGTSAPWSTQNNSSWGTGGSGQVGNAAHWARNEQYRQGNQSGFGGNQFNQGGNNQAAQGGYRSSPGYSGPGGYRSSSVQRAPTSENTQFGSGPGFQRSTKSVTPGRQASATPVNQYDGPRMYYQRTPRSARELSPRATIQHLQYNSPLAMYSPEAAAEAYKMQTGQDIPIDGDYPTGGRPVYLDSATRRLIAEEEQGRRYRSPTPQQSGSFKRISYAVGTPVN